jgi:hypothetical protein
VDFSEARNLFGIIFQIPGAFMKICGLRVDIQDVQGPFCKVVEINEFPDLIYNRKFRGPSPRCGGPTTCSGPRWTAGGVDTGRGGALPTHGTWALGLAGAHDEAQQGEGDTRNSIGCSPGRGPKIPLPIHFSLSTRLALSAHLAFGPASPTGLPSPSSPQPVSTSPPPRASPPVSRPSGLQPAHPAFPRPLPH